MCFSLLVSSFPPGRDADTSIPENSKDACPTYYCYAYGTYTNSPLYPFPSTKTHADAVLFRVADDATALFTCPGTSNADYTITFCKIPLPQRPSFRIS